MFATRDDDTIVRLHEVGVELPRPMTLRTLGRRAEMLPALRDLSLAVRCGQTLGIVGEHGSGKSTLATNLAGYFAWQGELVMLGDIDRQQTARPWHAPQPRRVPRHCGCNWGSPRPRRAQSPRMPGWPTSRTAA